MEAVIGHVFCEECSEQAGLLPDVSVSIECRSNSEQQLVYYSATRTSDLNGAFMASIPVHQLPKTHDLAELCTARVLGGPVEFTSAHKAVPLMLKSLRNGHFVYTTGAMFYKPEHAFN